MPRWMVALAAVGVVVLAGAGEARAAAGFAVGAALGILGFHWMVQSVMALLDANLGRVTRGAVAKIVLRYVLTLAGIFLFYYTGWLPVLAVIAGMLIPAAGVLVESLFLVAEGLRRRETN
jgi:hypothetical protein